MNRYSNYMYDEVLIYDGNYNIICINKASKRHYCCSPESMIAKYMHSISLRKDKSFIGINCASIPSELFECELFGYSKGAFIGASNTGKK